MESLVTPGSVPASVFAALPLLHGHGASPNVGPAGAAVVVAAAVVAVVVAVDDPVVDAVVEAVVLTASLPGVETAVVPAVVGVAAVDVGATVADADEGVVDVRLLPHAAVTSASVMNAADQRNALCLFMKSPR